MSLLQPLLRQLLYVIDLVGPDHVGLGLDYVFDSDELNDYLHLIRRSSRRPRIADGIGMVAPEALGAIAEGLARDNLTDAQIRGIFGENWLSVARASGDSGLDEGRRS